MELKTPLYDCHVAAGGKIVPFAGYLLPVQYTGVIKEHMAVRTACGLFDVSHMGEFLIKGADALNNVQNLFCNDFENMYDGQVRYSPMCNERGGIVDYVLIYKVNGEADYEPVKTEGLMNLAKLDTRDKYGAFLDGNNGYSVIEGNGTGSILVVKDSYANSFIPYLTANYAKIGVVDFRGLAYGLDSTIEKEGYDEVLVLYNFQTFIADTNLIYISRPSTLS